MRIKLSPLSMGAILALVGLNGWLAHGLLRNFMQPGEEAIGKPEWAPKLGAATESVRAAKPISGYGETLAHPVFFKTREPFVPPAAPPAAPAPPPVPVPVLDPGLVLAGVVIDREIKKAYVFSKTDPSGAWVREGDTFLGWSIKSVTPSAIRLEQQGRSLELRLYPEPLMEQLGDQNNRGSGRLCGQPPP